MKKILFLLLISLLSINQAISQESEQAILDKFFEIYADNSTVALSYLYSTSEWIDDQGDAVKDLKSQLQQFETLVGKYFGKEFLYKNELGKSFVTYIYFVKYERQPLRLTFKFYKANDKWAIYSFKFDDTFDEDLEDMIKKDYLQNKH